MPSVTSPITILMPVARSVAIAALMGATMLVSPLTTARADPATPAAVQLAQAANPAGAGATQGHARPSSSGLPTSIRR